MADERVHIYVTKNLYEQLEQRCRPGQSIDDLMDELMADESKWSGARPKASTPACPFTTPHPDNNVPEPTVPCLCCASGCRCAFRWRGDLRCGCTPERILFIDAGGKFSD